MNFPGDIEVKNIKSGEIISGRYLQENKIRTSSGVEYNINCTPNKQEPITFKLLTCNKLTANELGLWCSNVAIWHEAQRDALENVIIFEDDVYALSPGNFKQKLDKFISHLPLSYDVAYISHVSWDGKEAVNEHVVEYVSTSKGYGAFGVIYSAKGINKLLNIDHYEAPIDLFLFRYDKNVMGYKNECPEFIDSNVSLEIYGIKNIIMSCAGSSEMERY